MSAPLSKYVYLFKCGEFYKIGRSNRPYNRRKALDVFAHPIEVICIINAGNGQRVEQELHRKYAHGRVRGEWFRLTSEEVHEIRMHPRSDYKHVGLCGHEIENIGFDGRCWSCSERIKRRFRNESNASLPSRDSILRGVGTLPSLRDHQGL